MKQPTITLAEDDVMNQLLHHLEEKTPLSIIRYGDGEAIVLNSFNDLQTYKMVLKRQLGYIPAIDEAEQIRENLIEAYKGCDIIGIPMHKNLKELSSHWVKAEEILDANVPEKTEYRCSIDVHYDMLAADHFDLLLRDKGTLNYISCRDINDGFQRKYDIGQVNNFLIAPEMKFTSGYEGERHYPNQYNKVQRWMDKCRVEGQLCLVGAGYVGKIYCNWFRDRGGIALDIGSIFDLWAGKLTRGKERGMDKEDLTYKL